MYTIKSADIYTIQNMISGTSALGSALNKSEKSLLIAFAVFVKNVSLDFSFNFCTPEIGLSVLSLSLY